MSLDLKLQEEVLDKTFIIQKELNNEDYVYDSVTINGSVYSEDSKELNSVSYVKYAASFSKDTVLKIKDVEEFDY